MTTSEVCVWTLHIGHWREEMRPLGELMMFSQLRYYFWLRACVEQGSSLQLAEFHRTNLEYSLPLRF